jgi:hypothetical protein
MCIKNSKALYCDSGLRSKIRKLFRQLGLTLTSFQSCTVETFTVTAKGGLWSAQEAFYLVSRVTCQCHVIIICTKCLTDRSYCRWHCRSCLIKATKLRGYVWEI